MTVSNLSELVQKARAPFNEKLHPRNPHSGEFIEVMYHVAPSEHYESILAHGIDSSLSPNNFGNAYVEYDKGNYVFNDKTFAAEFADDWEKLNNKPYDIWAVDTKPGVVRWEDDPQDAWNENPLGMMAREPIPPEVVTLHERSPKLKRKRRVNKARAPFNEKLHPRNPHTGEWIEAISGLSPEIIGGLHIGPTDIQREPGLGSVLGAEKVWPRDEFPRDKEGIPTEREFNGEEIEAIRRGLTPAEARAGNDYTSNLSREINAVARGVDPFPSLHDDPDGVLPTDFLGGVSERERQRAEAIAAIPVLDKLIEDKGQYPAVITQRGGSLPIPASADPHTIFHGLNWDNIPESAKESLQNEGHTFTEEGFMSATYDIDTARGFSGGDWGDNSGGTLLQITIPEDVKALFVPDYFSGPANQREGEFVFPRGRKFRVDSYTDDDQVQYSYHNRELGPKDLYRQLRDDFPSVYRQFGKDPFDELDPSPRNDAIYEKVQEVLDWMHEYVDEEYIPHIVARESLGGRTIELTMLPNDTGISESPADNALAVSEEAEILGNELAGLMGIKKGKWLERLHPRDKRGRFVRVFAHGILTWPETMRTFAPGARLVGEAELPNWKRDKDSGVSNVEPSQGSSTSGVLWDVPESEIPELDQLEGVPDFYQKFTLPVLSGGKQSKALVYAITRQEDSRQHVEATPYLGGVDTYAEAKALWTDPVERLSFREFEYQLASLDMDYTRQIGMYQGKYEPSYSIRSRSEGGAVDAIAGVAKDNFAQESIAAFSYGSGEDFEVKLTGFSSADDVGKALLDAGIDGGNFPEPTVMTTYVLGGQGDELEKLIEYARKNGYGITVKEGTANFV